MRYFFATGAGFCALMVAYGFAFMTMAAVVFFLAALDVIINEGGPT